MAILDRLPPRTEVFHDRFWEAVISGPMTPFPEKIYNKSYQQAFEESIYSTPKDKNWMVEPSVDFGIELMGKLNDNG